MNVNTNSRKILYCLILLGLSFLLFREYRYIHPYNPGWGMLGPKWTYSSTKTFTWWFLLISSFILITPLIRKQKIGFIGLLVFTVVLIRPFIQNKFPEETVSEFYSKRKKELSETVKQIEIKNHVVINQDIKNLGFEKLIVKDSIYYFFFFDEEFPFGICYTKRKNLPKNTLTFGRTLKYNIIENEWYELDE
ncbi:MAG: hypothetical protein ACK476_12455 [Fluviicola sp.]